MSELSACKSVCTKLKLTCGLTHNKTTSEFWRTSKLSLVVFIPFSAYLLSLPLEGLLTNMFEGVRPSANKVLNRTRSNKILIWY